MAMTSSASDHPDTYTAAEVRDQPMIRTAVCCSVRRIWEHVWRIHLCLIPSFRTPLVLCMMHLVSLCSLPAPTDGHFRKTSKRNASHGGQGTHGSGTILLLVDWHSRCRPLWNQEPCASCRSLNYGRTCGIREQQFVECPCPHGLGQSVSVRAVRLAS